MNVLDVMQELGGALDTIAGLRVFSYWADQVSPPWAMVEMPDQINYDAALARGADKVTVKVLVGVARTDARSGCAALAAYADGVGASSVKAAIESHTASSYDSARVVSAEFGEVIVADVKYYAITFTVDLIGGGL